MIDPRTSTTLRTRRWSRALVTGAVTASLGLTAVVGVASGATVTSAGGTGSSGHARGSTHGTVTALGSGSSGTTHATSSGS